MWIKLWITLKGKKIKKFFTKVLGCYKIGVDYWL